MSQELEHCPFCGDEPREFRVMDESVYSHAAVEYLQIKCDKCGASSVQSEEHDEVIAAWNRRTSLAEQAAPAAPADESANPALWHEGQPPFPQDQEWFIAETTYGDRVVLRSLDEGRKHLGNYAFKTADGTYFKEGLVKRWMQFPDCEYLPPAPGSTKP